MEHTDIISMAAQIWPGTIPFPVAPHYYWSNLFQMAQERWLLDASIPELLYLRRLPEATQTAYRAYCAARRNDRDGVSLEMSNLRIILSDTLSKIRKKKLDITKKTEY